MPARQSPAAPLSLTIRHIGAAERAFSTRFPPGNRLEKLMGNRKGEYSIRVNNQWRICFRWRNPDAYEVVVADYH
ncbi:MAG: type II toxin-antitoxin system RelE/ParE family toxin [Chitinivibrionia bacterium]|nr:type II toxin-antitoxin system RelE/ParE family toxin [Chitinivibrionia bacterium]